jgi:hypothetical protein
MSKRDISDDDMDLLRAVREHGRGGAAAQGDGDQVPGAARGGGRHLRRPALLPRPRWLHDRGLHLRQPPHRATGTRRMRHTRHAAAGTGSLQATRRRPHQDDDDDACCTVRAGDGQRRQLRRRCGGDEVLLRACVHGGLIEWQTLDRSTGTAPAF